MEVTYTLDGKTSYLTSETETYTGTQTAPATTGTYTATVTATNERGSSMAKAYLIVDDEAPQVVDLAKYLPDFMGEIREFQAIFSTENKELDKLHAEVTQNLDNAFLATAQLEVIERLEKYLGVNPTGTIAQRKDYLLTLLQNGVKTNKSRLEAIIKNITGGEALIKFYAAQETGNPYAGYGYLEIKVLSPALDKNYNFDNVERAIKPLVAAHLKLAVMKYFATWQDVQTGYGSWADIKSNAENWDSLYNYTAPQ